MCVTTPNQVKMTAYGSLSSAREAQNSEQEHSMDFGPLSLHSNQEKERFEYDLNDLETVGMRGSTCRGTCTLTLILNTSLKSEEGD